MSFTDPVVGGTVLRTPAIQSPNYSAANATGWAIFQDGSAVFYNITASGTVTGATVVVDGANGGVFLYSGAPALGNLIGWWAAAAGTDTYGNNFTDGFAVANGSGSIKITQGGPAQNITLDTGNPSISLDQFITAFNNGTGNAETDTFEISGSRNSSNQDNAGILLGSSSNDLTTDTASVVLFYAQPSIPGGFADYFKVSYHGAVILAGDITPVHPGTGTSYTNTAIAETWQSPINLSSTLWTTTGANIPARFRMEPNGTVRLSGELLTTGVGPWPANANVFSIGPGYAPIASTPFITRSDIAVAAGQNTVNVLSTGHVQNGQTFTAAGQRLFFDGITYPTT